MTGIEVKVDPHEIARLAGVFRALGKDVDGALARAINHTGDKARTQMVRVLVGQTGLSRRVFVKALHSNKASAGSLTYTIRSAGGNVSLKHFQPRETAGGVTAAPWNRRQVYPHTFVRAGWWPKRVDKPGWNGQVWLRAPAAVAGQTNRGTFIKQKSGLYIPEEMLKGASAAAFNQVVARDLPDRMLH